VSVQKYGFAGLKTAPGRIKTKTPARCWRYGCNRDHNYTVLYLTVSFCQREIRKVDGLGRAATKGGRAVKLCLMHSLILPETSSHRRKFIYRRVLSSPFFAGMDGFLGTRRPEQISWLSRPCDIGWARYRRCASGQSDRAGFSLRCRGRLFPKCKVISAFRMPRRDVLRELAM